MQKLYNVLGKTKASEISKPGRAPRTPAVTSSLPLIHEMGKSLRNITNKKYSNLTCHFAVLYLTRTKGKEMEVAVCLPGRWLVCHLKDSVVDHLTLSVTGFPWLTRGLF